MRAVGFPLRTLEWKLEKMPREIPSLRAYKSCSFPSFGTLTVIVMDSSGLSSWRDIVTRRLLRLVTTDGPNVMAFAIK
jgi:hypothetical protein